jgi:hypothetical protein
LADEGIDLPIVERLRGNDHEVSYVAEMAPGLADDAVLELANRGGFILLTADRDFGELVFRQRKLTGGIGYEAKRETGNVKRFAERGSPGAPPPRTAPREISRERRRTVQIVGPPAEADVGGGAR